ncbi:MAG: hypothetical protein KHY96_06480 [Lachnospiraceae bacterium]|nr:hypothetical protein [Lachnospiraceae bacterium]
MRQTEQRLWEYFQNQKIWKGDSDSEEIEQMALTKTIQLAELEQRGRRKRKPIGFRTFLLEQIRLTGMRIWSVQIGIVLVIFMLLDLLTGMEFEYFTAKSFVFLAGGIGVLLFSSVVPVLYRARRYQMLEVEASARYSIWELLLTRILIYGTGSLCMLFCVVWQIRKVSPLPLMQTIWCLCLPFLAACNGGIYLLRKVKFFHFQRWAYGMCVGMVSILAKFAQSYSEYYQVESLVFPALMALFAVGIVYQCIDLLRKEGRTVCE